MAGKFYAVRNGRKAGIFGSWDECKKQIDGFSGAVYKSFKTKTEAEAFLNVGKIDENEVFDGVVAYVDGSYDKKTHQFSYGVIILKDGEEHEFCEKFDDPELADMRNVSGEIKGAEFAMQYCIDNGIKSIKIYYDYEGVSRWCLGEWKTNKDGTKAYKAFYDSIKNDLKVHFIKVKSHSGDKYNDVADYLAKKALGLV
ncbi:MAG: ribonuclease H family protein [Clostridia bacterium]